MRGSFYAGYELTVNRGMGSTVVEMARGTSIEFKNAKQC